MGIELTGDVQELEFIRRGLAKLSTAETRHDLAELIAQAAKDRVAMEFDEHVDPYGHPWKALRSRDGQPLTDTERLANSFAFQAVGDTVRIGTNVAYAGVHQYGATITAKTKKGLRFRVGGARPRTSGQWVTKQAVTIPQRQMVPEGDLGPVWTADFEAEANAILDEAFRSA